MYLIVSIHMQTLITAVAWITASQIYILMLIIQLINVYTPVHKILIIMQILILVIVYLFARLVHLVLIINHYGGLGFKILIELA